MAKHRAKKEERTEAAKRKAEEKRHSERLAAKAADDAKKKEAARAEAERAAEFHRQTEARTATESARTSEATKFRSKFVNDFFGTIPAIRSGTGKLKPADERAVHAAVNAFVAALPAVADKKQQQKRLLANFHSDFFVTKTPREQDIADAVFKYLNTSEGSTAGPTPEEMRAQRQRAEQIERERQAVAAEVHRRGQEERRRAEADRAARAFQAQYAPPQAYYPTRSSTNPAATGYFGQTVHAAPRAYAAPSPAPAAPRAKEWRNGKWRVPPPTFESSHAHW